MYTGDLVKKILVRYKEKEVQTPQKTEVWVFC